VAAAATAAKKQAKEADNFARQVAKEKRDEQSRPKAPNASKQPAAASQHARRPSGEISALWWLNMGL